jgi:hypothetical protein
MRPPHFTETESETDDKIALRESLANLALGLMPPAALLISAAMAVVMTVFPQLSNNDKAWDFARNLFVGGAFGGAGGAARKIASRREESEGGGSTPYSSGPSYPPVNPNPYPNISPDAPAIEQSEPRAAGFKLPTQPDAEISKSFELLSKLAQSVSEISSQQSPSKPAPPQR